MKYILLVLFIFPTLSLAQVEGLNNEAEILSETEKVMKDFFSMNYSSAFEKMTPFSVLPLEDFNDLKKQSIEQSSLITSNYGKTLELRLVEQNRVDNFFVTLTYVIRHEKYGLKFQFDFYKGKDDKWRMTNFLWNNELRKLID